MAPGESQSSRGPLAPPGAMADDAPTPRRGEPAVGQAGHGARPTRGLSRRHWNGLGFVLVGLTLIALLVLFLLLRA